MRDYTVPLEVCDLHFSYDKKEVLKGVSGTFYPGTFYGIAGPNGSGKTTWLKLMAGLFDSEQANVSLFNQDTKKMNRIDMAKRLSFVPQMFNIPYAFSVKDVVMMGRYPYLKRMANPLKEDHAIVDQTLIETNLDQLKDRNVNELSGGELQRVIIARAIAQDTDIILLDEPISHLDIYYQHEIITLLKKLCREKDKTIIAVLHELNITVNHCDHILLLKDGNVIEQGEPRVVLTEEVIKTVYDLEVTLAEANGQTLITW